MRKYKSRDEVEEKYKWDLSDFFHDDKEFEQELENAKKLIKQLEKYIGCTSNAKKLYEYLEYEVNTLEKCQHLYIYAYLINDQELGNPHSLERKNKASTIFTEFEKNTKFLENELLKLSKSEYQQLFIDDPRLLDYQFQLDSIYRKKDHILDYHTEKMLKDFTSSINHFEDISTTLIHKERDYGEILLEDKTKENISIHNYRMLLKDKNEQIRKQVYESFNKKLDQYSNTSAALLNSYSSMRNTLAKFHNFDSFWNQKLFELQLNDNIFAVLKNAAGLNLSSLHRYYQLKKRALKLEKLHAYDLYLPMVENDLHYDIEEGQEIIKNALRPLGEEYLDKYDKVINNRYIDYCQYPSKFSGGYSYSSIGKNARILINYKYDFISLSTLAHEVGHHIHDQFIIENNKPQYQSTYLIIAEIASLTNEFLLSDYLLKNGRSKEEKLIGLENALDVFVTNFYGAVREGKIEEQFYQKTLSGETVTKQFLDDITTASLKEYYGNVVEFDEYSKNGWITRVHNYWDFYIYNYAICVSVACNLASKIVNGDQQVIKQYLEFLKVGHNHTPIEIYQKLGICLEDPQIYKDAINYFDYLITEYNNILDKE